VNVHNICRMSAPNRALKMLREGPLLASGSVTGRCMAAPVFRGHSLQIAH
jgi:hypothetical protein